MPRCRSCYFLLLLGFASALERQAQNGWNFFYVWGCLTEGSCPPIWEDELCETYQPIITCSCDTDLINTNCEFFGDVGEPEVSASQITCEPPACFQSDCSDAICSGCSTVDGNNICVTTTIAETKVLGWNPINVVGEYTAREMTVGSSALLTVMDQVVYDTSYCRVFVGTVECDACALDVASCTYTLECSNVAGVDEASLVVAGACPPFVDGPTETSAGVASLDVSHPLYGLTRPAEAICQGS